MADTSFFDSVYDPFVDDREDGDDRPKKKARFGRRSDQWTFVERTPSPEAESQHEDLEASHQSVQKHGQEDQLILTDANVASVGNSDLLNTIDHVLVTQNPGLPGNQSQIKTPASFAADDYSDTNEFVNELPLALPSLSNVPPSLKHGREKIVHVGENGGHGDAHTPGIASSESGNDEASKQTPKATGLQDALLSQFHAHEEESPAIRNEPALLHGSDAQTQHLILETDIQKISDAEVTVGLERDEDMPNPSSLNVTPDPVSDLVHFDLDGAMISRLRPSEHETYDDGSYIETPVEPAQGHITVRSIANIFQTGERADLEILDGGSVHETVIRSTDARSSGSSESEIQDATAILNTQRTPSVSEDEGDALEPDREVDAASSVGTEEGVDYFGREVDERENTVDSTAEVRREDSSEVCATAFDEDGELIEVVGIDRGDEEEETALEEEEEEEEEEDESGDFDNERFDLLELLAHVETDDSEDYAESSRSGEELGSSFAEVPRPGVERHDRDEESQGESESNEDADPVDSEYDGLTRILAYSNIPPIEGSEESEGSQLSVQGDSIPSMDAANSIDGHDHAIEDDGAEHDSSDDTEGANLESDDQLSILDYPDELLTEGPDGSQHSTSTEAVSLGRPAISEVEHEHESGDELYVSPTDEDSVMVDLADDSPTNIRERPAEVSNKEIDESFPTDKDQATNFARAATSLIEHGQRDENDEESDSDADEESTDLDEGQASVQDDSAVSFITVPEKTSQSDAKEVVSMAESAKSAIDNGREDQPDSQSYSALARNAILQAESQEGITMDEALHFPLERLSSPAEDRTVPQDLKGDRGSRQVIHDSGDPGEEFPFPFTPQLSGLSASSPDLGTFVGHLNIHHRPAKVVIENPTSSFSLPGYDSVLEDFDTEPRGQLITPLATQDPKIEEDDDEMKSQLDLAFEDEMSKRRVDDSGEDDTISPPLLGTNAASRSLVGILRSLERSSGKDYFSGQTGLWSDVSASKKSLQKEERSSRRESESIGSLVDHYDHTAAKSQDHSSPHNISDTTKIEGDLSKHSTDKTPLQTSQLDFRTQFSYFAPLSTIEQHFNSTVDVLATVVSSTKPSRATKGPRDYHQTISITDPSSSSSSANTIPSCTTAQIFRPYKQALPILQPGDALLLRNFKVQLQKHRPMLLSTEASAWAVFGQDTDVQIRGPHVEFGKEEVGIAETLTEWWHGLGSDVHRQLASSIPPAAPSSRGRPKGKKREKRVSEVVHELRDGTKYTDGGKDMNSIHQLRDGTMYADEERL